MSERAPLIRQIRAARALLGWSQYELATKADLSVTSVATLESREQATDTGNATGQRACAALTAAGIQFTREEGDWIGVRLRTTALDVYATECRIENLEAAAAGIDLSGPPSPQRAMNTMKRAMAKNDAANLRGRLKRKNREERRD